MVPSYQALAEGVTADRVLDAVIASVQLPRIDFADEATA